MVSLILNENMKLYRRVRTWIMLGLLAAAVFLGSFTAWHYQGDKYKGDAWIDHVKEEQQQLTKILQDPKLDVDYRERLQERIAINDYHLTQNIRTTDGTIWNGINNCAELIILITLFTVIVAGDSMAGEFTNGTIKLLLIRPASRLKILVSKYISLLIFGLLLVILLFVVSFLVNAILFGLTNLNLPYVHTNEAGQVVESSLLANLWKTYALNGISTIIFVTMAFMISTAFRSSTMAIGISIFALFAGTILLEVLHPYAWSKYLLFANIDLSQYLSGKPYQEGMTFSFSVTLLATYFIVFNLIAWFVFTRRDVAA